MKYRILGVFLFVVGLWGGSFAVHFLPEYLSLASLATGACMALSGLALAFNQ